MAHQVVLVVVVVNTLVQVLLVRQHKLLSQEQDLVMLVALRM
jgi:hypothetical protein